MTSTVDYSWLRAERAAKFIIHEPGFVHREIAPAGEHLYDPQLGWRERDGSIFFSDIGGQEQYGWDPQKGHGAIARLKPNGQIEYLVRPGNMGTYMPLCPVLAPEEFAPHQGCAFLTGQTYPGRAGATRTHAVFIYRPGADRMELFCEVPHAGTVSGGVPGALVTGWFGKKNGPFEGDFFVISLMNCVIYRVTPDRRCEPFLILDKPLLPEVVMPLDFGPAPEWMPEHAGHWLIFGQRNTKFTDEADREVRWAHWRVSADGKIDPTPIDEPRNLMSGVKAPPEFGPFGGHIFYADEGGVDLLHVTKFDVPLPYSARIMRIDPQGREHVFADNFQGSSTSLVFDKNRLVISLLGKSYSTGDYHHPDGSISEIVFQG
ncbi:MAG: hypothetical protein KF700_00805 [Hyphomonadaceae bacterium]|nr:hypothetical protein [Hyphomonadaceae bacterium]